MIRTGTPPTHTHPDTPSSSRLKFRTRLDGTSYVSREMNLHAQDIYMRSLDTPTRKLLLESDFSLTIRCVSVGKLVPLDKVLVGSWMQHYTAWSYICT